MKFKATFNFSKMMNVVERALTVNKNKILFMDIADFMVDRVQSFTRAGKDLKNNAKQPPLNPDYIRFRKRLAKGKSKSKIQIASKYFRPAKSNLTLTGQLLDSITHKISFSSGTIKIYPAGRRIKYQEYDFDTNQELANDLAQRGREFLAMDDKGLKRIRQMVVRRLRDIKRFKK